MFIIILLFIIGYKYAYYYIYILWLFDILYLFSSILSFQFSIIVSVYSFSQLLLHIFRMVVKPSHSLNCECKCHNSCLSNYCTFHISYVTTKIQNNIHEKKYYWRTSCRSCWSGLSSKSHLMFSIAMHRGKISLNTPPHIPCNDQLWCPHMQHSSIQHRHLILCSMIYIYIYIYIYAPKLDWLSGWIKLYCN